MEIKFRAEYQGKIYEVENIYFQDEYISLVIGDFNAGNVIKPKLSEVNLMQYTGLKDKNNVEIYEGDILLNTKYRPQKIEVYWRGCVKEKGCVNGDEWIDWGGWHFKKSKDDKRVTFGVDNDAIEVIGNIYQNPELLKND